MAHDNPLRIPEPLRHDAEEIFKLTDPFCAAHLDAEYGELVRALVAKLARKRPSPLARGDLRIWAGAAIYAVGSVNFLFDPTQCPHLTGDELTGVPKSTLANKAKVIRDVLRIGPLEPEFCGRERLDSNPMTWMISAESDQVGSKGRGQEAEAWRRVEAPRSAHSREADRILRELATAAMCHAIVPSGYRGQRGELWYARVLPPPIPGGSEHVVFTTPYVLLEPGIHEWQAYLRRTLPDAPKQARIDANGRHMKYGPTRTYWNDFVFEGYVNHRTVAIYLAGLPDVPESRPHSEANRRRFRR